MKTARHPVVLLVDDQAIVAEAIQRMLAGTEIAFHYCGDAAQALQVAETVAPTIILQDLVMPDVDGFTLARFFKAHPKTSNVPIIVLSTKENPRDKSRAFADGVSDYLVKLPDKIELLARVRAHSKSYMTQLERDEAYQALSEMTAKLEESNAQLERLSVTDALTGIANRRRYEDTLDLEWRRAQREKTPIGLLMIDVDYFKKFNDAYGHRGGDDCLKRVAQVLPGACRRPADLAARYGGEEFVLLLPNTPGEGAAHVAERIRADVAALNMPHVQSDVAPHVTVSIGAASVVPETDAAPAVLVESADQALYAAKRGGRNRFVLAETGAMAPSAVSLAH